MNKDKLKIERMLLKTIIGMVHNNLIRISDTCQRELVFLIRSRVPDNKIWEELNLKEIEALIKKLADEISATAPESNQPKKRAVIRRSFLKKITSFLSVIWPFGE